MTPWFNQNMSFAKLVSMANSNSSLVEDQSTQHPPPKRHKLHDAIEALNDNQRQALSDLLSGKAALVKIEGHNYAVMRTKYGWSLTTMEGVVHSVNCDLSLCSCEDFKFRQHVCKHIRGLQCFCQGS